MKKALLVISNHNPDGWSEAQKSGWDDIKYHPFPEINPHFSTEDIIKNYVKDICSIIGNFYRYCDETGSEGYVTLQGEFSVCHYVWLTLWGTTESGVIKFIFPTTERKIIEEEGGRKVSIFEFVRWR